jgi:16S rRNA (uracil1498-N3)-methyltransferase
MRLTRCYTDQDLYPGEVLLLDQQNSHHLFRVLRMRQGDKLILFNGDGKEYQAVVQGEKGRLALVLVQSLDEPLRESNLRITLGQGVSRGERMDFVLQKSVELGVAGLTPIWTRRSQVQLSGARLDKKMHHWRGVVRSASEQSGRVRLPVLDQPTDLPSWCRHASTEGHRIVLDPGCSGQLKDLPRASRVCILIGPEGGLDDDEISAAEKCGFVRVRLGPRVMRTETAALVALAAAQTLWGDLGN